MYTSIAHGELMGSTDSRQMPVVLFHTGYLKAVESNAGNVYVGSSSDVAIANGSTDTTTTGFELGAGDVLPLEYTGNLSHLWYICDNAGDELTYIVWNST